MFLDDRNVQISECKESVDLPLKLLHSKFKDTHACVLSKHVKQRWQNITMSVASVCCKWARLRKPGYALTNITLRAARLEAGASPLAASRRLRPGSGAPPPPLS